MESLLPDLTLRQLQLEYNRLRHKQRLDTRETKRKGELEEIFRQQNEIRKCLNETFKYREYLLPADREVLGHLGSVIGRTTQETPVFGELPEGLDSTHVLNEFSEMTLHLGGHIAEEERLQSLVTELVNFSPTIGQDLEPWREDPYGERLIRAQNAFSKHVLHPAGRMVCSFPDKVTGLPKVVEGKLLGAWREFPAPIGLPARAVSAVWLGLDHGEGARTIDQEIFMDFAAINGDSVLQYQHIMKRTNPIDCVLEKFFREVNLTAQEYCSFLEHERLLCEEVEHAHDHSFQLAYKQTHRTGNSIHLSLLLRQEDDEYWNDQLQKRNRSSLVPIIAIKEVSGQLGGTLRQMKTYQAQGALNSAFLVFLNFLSHLIRMRNDFQIVKKLLDAGHFAPALSYGMAAERMLAHLGIKDISATEILTHCRSTEHHPAEVGLRLLEHSYEKNVIGRAQREELLREPVSEV